MVSNLLEVKDYILFIIKSSASAAAIGTYNFV